jgi:hypothetical protein
MPHTIFTLLLKTSYSSKEGEQSKNKVYNNNIILVLLYINKSIRFAYFIINETEESDNFSNIK